MINKEQLVKMLDHTLLKPEFTTEEIREGAKYAQAIGTASYCIAPSHVATAAEVLKNSDVKVCTVIGFPHGNHTPEVKAFETKEAYENGAREMDMVLNIGAAKEGNWNLVKRDIQAVVEASPAPVKVILENTYLTREEIVKACQMAEAAGAAFVKTSTGFASSGATVEDVKLMRESVSSAVQVKASGGIRNRKVCEEMIAAGADRLGVSGTAGILLEYNE